MLIGEGEHSFCLHQVPAVRRLRRVSCSSISNPALLPHRGMPVLTFCRVLWEKEIWRRWLICCRCSGLWRIGKEGAVVGGLLRFAPGRVEVGDVFSGASGIGMIVTELLAADRQRLVKGARGVFIRTRSHQQQAPPVEGFS